MILIGRVLTEIAPSPKTMIICSDIQNSVGDDSSDISKYTKTWILNLKNSKHRLFLFAQTKFYNP